MSQEPSQNNELASVNCKDMMKQASQHFNKNQFQKSQSIYTSILEQGRASNEQKLGALKNRACVYLGANEYKKCLDDIERYLKEEKKAGPQVYVMKVTVLVRMENIEGAKVACKQGMQMYPYHKKLQQMAKLCKQKQMTQNQETYVEHIFEKLCLHPKIRHYLKEESFLTKVQRVIRNPSLASVLANMDPRIIEVTEFILMADQEED